MAVFITMTLNTGVTTMDGLGTGTELAVMMMLNSGKTPTTITGDMTFTTTAKILNGGKTHGTTGAWTLITTNKTENTSTAMMAVFITTTLPTGVTTLDGPGSGLVIAIKILSHQKMMRIRQKT